MAGNTVAAIWVGADQIAWNDGKQICVGAPGQAPRLRIDASPMRLRALALLPDGTLLSAGDDGTPRRWDLKTGQLLQTFGLLEAPQPSPTRVVANPDFELRVPTEWRQPGDAALVFVLADGSRAAFLLRPFPAASLADVPMAPSPGFIETGVRTVPHPTLKIRELTQRDEHDTREGRTAYILHPRGWVLAAFEAAKGDLTEQQEVDFEAALLSMTVR
jgi:hypothetical protein